MDVLTIKDIAIIATPFLLFALGVIVTATGFLVKGLVRDLKASIQAASEKIAQVEKDGLEKVERVGRDFMEFKAQMPRQYVLKDDYVRTMSTFEFKLDGLGKKIDSLAGREHGEP